jgi:hypothetical protein
VSPKRLEFLLMDSEVSMTTEEEKVDIESADF